MWLHNRVVQNLEAQRVEKRRTRILFCHNIKMDSQNQIKKAAGQKDNRLYKLEETQLSYLFKIVYLLNIASLCGFQLSNVPVLIPTFLKKCW